jgi:PAS domain S-box-containing protein
MRAPVDLSSAAREPVVRRSASWRHRALFERAPHAYLLTDGGGVIRDANEAACQLFDRSREGLIGKPLAVFLHPGYRVAFHAQLARLRGLRRVIEYELRLGGPAGWDSVTAAVGAVRDELDRPAGLAWILHPTGERQWLLHEVVQAAEDERSRLAAELHDRAMQHLAAVSLRLGSARKRLAAGDLAAVASLLSRCESELAGELGILRRLVAGLRPPALDDFGLAAALEQLLAAVARDTGAKVRLEVRLDDRLPREIETALYRVAEEALTNIVKHAAAERVVVLLRVWAGGLELRVRDDGKGFDLEEIGGYARQRRFGLVGMRQRVEMLGGSWRVRSAPGHGTVVTVQLPLPEAR